MDSVTKEITITVEADVYYTLDKGDPETGQGPTVEIDDIRLNGVEITDEVSDHDKETIADEILGDWLEGEPRDD